MNIELVKKLFNAEAYGTALAHASDSDQATVINAMALEMKICMKDRDRETQLCYLSAALSDSAASLIKDLAEFVKLREQNK